MVWPVWPRALPTRDGGEKRLYLVETAEKSLAWMRLTAHGRAGHGSFLHDENAVTILAEAVARLGRHTFPLVMTDAVAEFLRAQVGQLVAKGAAQVAAVGGLDVEMDGEILDQEVPGIGEPAPPVLPEGGVPAPDHGLAAEGGEIGVGLGAHHGSPLAKPVCGPA